MHRIDKQERKAYTAHEIGAVERELLKGIAERAAEEQFYDAEEVKYLVSKEITISNPILTCQHIITQH